MHPLQQRLLECLNLELVGEDLHRGVCEDDRHGRIFGGQVVGQALVAAQRSVEGRRAHSIHAYFLRMGDPALPIDFRVERTREGRAFATRQVLAVQDEEPIFQMIASFMREEEGYEHQATAPPAPDPESLPPLEELVGVRGARLPEGSRHWAGKPRSIDMRHAVVPYYLGGDVGREPMVAWFRTHDPLPDDPDLHRAIIAYTSDMSLNDTAIRAHGHEGPLGAPMMSSLDHAVWFHVDARADEWLLWVCDSPRAAAARGFSRGVIYRQDGVQVATVAQESLMRPMREPSPR
ncbi:acyl-CoA thioesterase II [Myxococcota bacterium]|nr:acyl-CoA thioesterase II [Myxococcota bacterium]